MGYLVQQSKMGILTAMTELLTVLTWLWSQPSGRATYTAQHVNTWADMVRRNLTIPHRIACVTDMPEGIDSRVSIIAPPRDFEHVRIPTWGEEKPQCLRRLAMFRRDASLIFGRRFVSMDMDCVIAGNIDDLFSRGEDLVLYKSPSGDIPNPRPYNGSMLMMTAGARPEVYERFTPEGAVAAGQQYVGSDQAWISHALGAGEATWSEEDGVVWWGRWKQGAQGRLMFFPGFPKPWDLLDDHEWIRLHYHRDRGGRCLVLGYAPAVWSEAAKALESGPFDAVIASPEAAEHWPGTITAIAKSDVHADRLVKMLGFDEVTFCGRSERVAA
ncbi:hypothetical protein V1291_000041 [Nitrobacteraceae bacterium AZCC 1564]